MTAPDKLEPQGPAVIKGEGFNSNGGGFSAIYIDGYRYEPEDVRRAVIAWNRRPTPSPEAGEVMRLHETAMAALRKSKDAEDDEAAWMAACYDLGKAEQRFRAYVTTLTASDPRAEAAEARAEKMRALLKRYRDETPLGHQPHMIAHEVDAALAADTDAGAAPSPAKPEGRE